MRNIINTRPIFTLVATISLAACTSNTWDGFVYPDKNNLKKYEYIGKFSSLEQCRAAALHRLNSIKEEENDDDDDDNEKDVGDYECGLNCKLNSYGLYICKETSH